MSNKILDDMRDVMRRRHYSIRTERSDCGWVNEKINAERAAKKVKIPVVLTRDGTKRIIGAMTGADTLVMSLWKVPDQQTREPMEEFYSRILAGEPRAEALKNAQMSIRSKHPHPFFWGAFICQGDPSPLPSG